MTHRQDNGTAERVHLFVSGLVQGVGFRYATRHRALDLGLTGWVRNTQDDRVEIEAWGPHEHIDELLAWLRQGPPSARVDHLDIRSRIASTPSFSGFEIRR